MNGLVLLAAGCSVRFGEDKRFAKLPDGKAMLLATLERIDESSVPCLVVLRHDDLDLIDQLANHYPRLHFVRCPESPLGMGYSLAFGVEQAAFRRSTGVAIALADMPLIEPATYRRVTHHISSEKIVIPRHQQMIGHPIGFGQDFFDQLKAIRGDQGARSVWQHNQTQVEYLDIEDAGILADIDTREDIPALEHPTE